MDKFIKLFEVAAEYVKIKEQQNPLMKNLYPPEDEVYKRLKEAVEDLVETFQQPDTEI
jgi:hypothetical protein